MVKTHFVKLAYQEGKSLITACRHGVVHLGWHNLTIRIDQADFRRLVGLVGKGQALTSPLPLCDGDLCISLEAVNYRLSIGSVELLLAPDEFLELGALLAQALKRLEHIKATNSWPDAKPAEDTKLRSLEELDTASFSLS